MRVIIQTQYKPSILAGPTPDASLRMEESRLGVRCRLTSPVATDAIVPVVLCDYNIARHLVKITVNKRLNILC